MYVIGLDVGTSGVKSTVFDEKATVLCHAYREYNLISQNPGWFELNPVELWEKTLEALKESTQNCDRKQVKAICVTSFGESFVCFDKENNILGNTMIYMDIRGEEECEELKSLIPEDEIFATCGQFVDKMFAAYKLRWLNKHRPEWMERVKRISFITDFITYMLGAEHVCEYSLAARSAMFEVKNKRWWQKGVEFAQIDADILPDVVPSGTATGTMSGEIAEELGMTTDVKLIVGGHDQIFAAIGSGANKPGDIANGIGTVDCFTSVMRGNFNLQKLREYNLPVVPFLNDTDYVTYAFNMSGGCVVKWFRDTFAQDIKNLSNAYQLLNDEMPGEPTGLCMIPYMAGGGTPYMDAKTPAALVGMRLNTTRGDVFQAFLEGETYEMRLNMECLQDAGIEANRIITVGGGSKSERWMQMRADIFNHNILLPSYPEAGTLASAMLCYANIGVYGSIAEAQNDLISYNREFIPNKGFVDKYNEMYVQYKKLYKTLKELN